MREQPLALLPEILAFLGGLLSLIVGSFLPRDRQWITRAIALIALLGTMAAAVAGLVGSTRTVFDMTYAVDTPTGIARIVAAGAAFMVICLGTDDLAGRSRESETYALILFSTTGALVVAGASDLLVLAVGFLLSSIPLYAIVGLPRTSRSAEATLKTYLMGALFGILLLLGITILYGLAGTTTYATIKDPLAQASALAVAVGVVAVFGGLMFKAGGVPAHFWVPDAAQGAGDPAAAFLTTVPKVGALVAAFRLATVLPDNVNWPLLVGVLAVTSMLVGNLAAYAQTDPRRLLGWSTVSQVGYVLVPVAVAGRSDLALPSLLFYLGAYAVTNVTAFAVTAALPERRELASYWGLSASRPWLAGALLIALLGLVGTPPTAVFVGKLTTATAAWDGGEPWLSVAVFVNTLVSLFYYLRWIVPSYRQTPGPNRTTRASFAPRIWAGSTAVVGALASIALGVTAGLVWPAVDGVLVR